jgi:hypothetical protein
MSEPQADYDTDARLLRAQFQKGYKPYGVRVCEETLDEIAEYEDCEIMAAGPEHPSLDPQEFMGVVVQTREGSLKAEEGDWIMEDSEGRHYPIAHEELRQTYEPITNEEAKPETDDTDAQPTPGPWKIRHGVVFSPEHYPGDINQIASILASTPNHHDEANANARLIAAAGTAAQEAKEMGYDPQEAVRALPELLKACQKNAERMPLAQQDAQNALASAEGREE